MDAVASAQLDIVRASLTCAMAEGKKMAFVYLDRAMRDEVYDTFAETGQYKDIVYSGETDYWAMTGRNMCLTTIHVYVFKLA